MHACGRVRLCRTVTNSSRMRLTGCQQHTVNLTNVCGIRFAGYLVQVLDATNNKLSAFPRALEELTQLQRATLSSNSIADVNGSVLLSLASTLKILVLDSNLISRVRGCARTDHNKTNCI
mmetsp:Transcript_28564/g.84542  ORF Transcript_28564/g.84542 Transcript_28564/m.84542 type:complete len:120 (+) Transcript_28564:158-517(+)